MKIKKLSWILLGSVLAVGTLAGCEKKNKKPAEEQQPSGDQGGGQQGGGEQGGQQGGEQGGGGQQTVNSYTITFKNYDETVLETKSVEEGQMPAYTGQTPVKEGDAQYSYTFEGWDPAIVVASADATYTATFTQSVNSYTVRFVNDDGTELQSETLEYGATPVYNGAAPTKETTAQYTYTFNGWDAEITQVTGNVTYTATYTSNVRSYCIRFINYDATILQNEILEYGATPVYNGATPEKPQTESTVFTFTGWDRPIEPVTAAADYFALYEESPRQYRVDFNLNGGGESTYEMVNYGETVAKPTDPTRAQDAEYIYFFDGWYNGLSEFDFNTPITEAITLVAHWHTVSATDHGDRCVWTHHPAKAPDYVNPGYVEFWTCNLHEGYVLVEPTEHYGDILEETEPWADPISNTDERYVAPLEGGNFFARINVGPENNNDAALPVFRSANSYSNVVGYKLRYRVSGAFAEGKSSWAGFFFGSESDDVYSAVDANKGGATINLYNFDGQWHDYVVRYETPMNGYFAFGHALTNFAEGTYIDVDDLVVYGDTVDSEEFARTPSIKLIASEFVVPGGEAKVAIPEEHNKFMRLQLVQGIDYSFGYSFKAYENISKISFKYRLNKEGGIKEGGTSAWFGVKTAASNKKMDSYSETGYLWNVNTANTSNYGSYFTGLWQDFECDCSTSGYVGIATCADFKNGTYLDIDDITIVTSSGTIVEDFESLAVLFGASSYADYQQYCSYGVEELVSTDMAFDPTKGELFIYNYAAKNTLVTENITDPDKGSCVRITEWHGWDNVWLAFPQTATHDDLVRGLNGEEPTEFYFSVYNSGANNVSLQLRYGKDDWNNKPTTTFVAGQWTDIVIPIDANVTDVTKISYYKWVGGDESSQTTICDANTQLTFTAIRVRHSEPQHDPSEFGVVAYNLQTGSIVSKEYSPTFNQSKGFDDVYGPYVQLDNWQCADNQNRCWIAFDGGAESVSDMETALGGSIGGYYFDIYNPLTENFTLNIILGASYVTAKAFTLSPQSWNRCEIALGAYDGGTLATPDQIGLDHTFANNGAVVGSGWKITSLFAFRAPADPAPFGVVAVDAETTSLETREYTPTFDLSRGVDDEYGAYLKIDNWTCKSDQNRSWVGFTSSASITDLETALGGEVDSYFFYFYNPTESNLAFAVQNNHHYTSIIYFTATAKSWTRIDVPLSKLDSPKTADLIGIDRTASANGEVIGSGFKVTSVYAEKATPSVNPAPFGVVAVDAQATSIETRKGYNSTFTTTTGIDENYGAYIQLNDWTCASNQSRAWIGMTKTTELSAIESALGGTPTKYFFYMYNPTDSVQHMELFIQKSAGLKTRIYVEMAAKSWSLFEFANGVLDSNDTALVEPHEIGLDIYPSGSNGQVLGSGWKITSIYAE